MTKKFTVASASLLSLITIGLCLTINGAPQTTRRSTSRTSSTTTTTSSTSTSHSSSAASTPSSTASSDASGGQNEKTTTTNNDNWNWNWRRSDNRIALSVSIHSRLEFNDDYSDVAAIPASDGWLHIKDSRGGVERRFEAEAGADGIKRTYSVSGRTAPFDGEARGWLKRVLNDTVRRGGY